MLLAVTLFGVKFSGREAAIVGLAIVVIIFLIWWVWQRRR